MPNKPNNPTRYARKNISQRLRELTKKGLPETTRQILQNEFEATALYWFVQAVGNAEDFGTAVYESKICYAVFEIHA